MADWRTGSANAVVRTTCQGVEVPAFVHTSAQSAWVKLPNKIFEDVRIKSGYVQLKVKKTYKSMLTIMHVTVSLCGIQLDGLQEVPLRFCFLPLRETD